MPRILVVDENFLTGAVYFNGTKIISVYFVRANGSQVYFTKRPSISLTPMDDTTIPPIRYEDIKKGNLFIGFKVKLGNTWTGTIAWECKEVG